MTGCPGTEGENLQDLASNAWQLQGTDCLSTHLRASWIFLAHSRGQQWGGRLSITQGCVWKDPILFLGWLQTYYPALLSSCQHCLHTQTKWLPRAAEAELQARRGTILNVTAATTALPSLCWLETAESPPRDCWIWNLNEVGLARCGPNPPAHSSDLAPSLHLCRPRRGTSLFRANWILPAALRSL